MVAGRSLPVAAKRVAAAGLLVCEREGKREERSKKGTCGGLNP
jgi:hypothetical protein